MSEAISIRKLVKRYPGAPKGQNAVDHVDLDIAAGEFVTLLGPSGCGKTSTLRMIAGLEEPVAGEIFFGGAPVYSDVTGVSTPVHQRPIGMVFQSYAIWPHMNVFDNVAFPLRMEKRSLAKAEIRARTEAALETVGLAGYGARPSTALSGGQQQRVALARALVRNPQILLLDEPLSNLDAKLREQMRDEIRDLQQRIGITTLFVTHDQSEALAVSDRIVVMKNGRIVEQGSPRAVYNLPADEFTADFIGVANKLPGVVRAISGDGVVVETPLGVVAFPHAQSAARPGETVCAFIRPSCLSLSTAPDANAWRGEVRRRVYQGDHTDYLVRLGDIELRVRSYETGEPLDAERAVFVTPHLARIQLHAGAPTTPSGVADMRDEPGLFGARLAQA